MDAVECALRVLGLGPDATEKEIKEAYRDLAMVWHPDRFPDGSRVQQKAEEKLKEVNEAYRILQGYRPATSASEKGHAFDENNGSRATKKSTKADRQGSASRARHAAPKRSPRRTPYPFSRRSLYFLAGAIAFIAVVGSFLSQTNPASTDTTTQAVDSLVGSENSGLTESKTVVRTDPSTSVRLNRTDNNAVGSATLMSSKQEGPSDGEGVRQEPSPVATPERSPPMEGSEAERLAEFGIGSTKDDVLAVQGTPTEFSDGVWRYGLSRVYFTDGRVTSWDISPLNPLDVRMEPSRRVPGGREYFTQGSSKDEVLTVQGTPTEFSDGVWRYGLSRVYFTDGRVTSWDISPLNPLDVRMEPSRRVPGGREYFTQGSSKDEVLTVQGTPTEFSDGVWRYGLSRVYFTDGRVTSWDISPLNPLDVRMESSRRVSGGRDYFTQRSSKDEVLAVQGTPTEFSDAVWKYGLSTVTFQHGLVVGWDESPLNPLKARLEPRPE